MLRGKLNLFQRAMLRWRTLHPYSAVHAVRIGGALVRDRLESDINAVLAAAGLTGLVVDEVRGRFEFTGAGPPVTLTVLPSGGDAAAAVAGEFERQLNEPFPEADRLEPFRFFAVDDGDTFRLGCAYDHFIGSGDSVVMLLRDIVARHTGSGPVARGPRERYPPTYVALAGRRVPELVRSLVRLPAAIAIGRRACGPPGMKVRDPHVGVHCFRVAEEGLAALLAAARHWGVTLNDLLIAILMQALAPLVPERQRAARRREIAVASIMNLRREFGPQAQTAFGQFLGVFRAQHAVPAGTGLEALAREVHAQTDRAKREKLYWHALLGLGTIGLGWSRLTDHQRERVYRMRQFPILAGISTLGVDGIWNDGGAPPAPLEYMRAISTGPSQPLVLGVTTASGVLHTAISYRTAVLPRPTVESLATDIVRTIEGLA